MMTPLSFGSSSLFASDLKTIPMHTLSISFDLENKTLFGTSNIVLPPHTPLELNCYGLHITGALIEPEGENYRMLRPLIGTSRYALPGSHIAATVKISWSLDLSKQSSPDNLLTPSSIILAGMWHPIPNIKMIHHLEAALPEGFVGICEAEQIKYINKKEVHYFEAKFMYPIYNLHFLAGPYVVKSKTMDNGPDVATYFFPEDAELAADYLKRTISYIKRYQTILGPFPYSQFSVVENRLPTGYGLPTFTLLGQAVIRLPFIKDTSLGHEVLHSWLGNSIDLKDESGNWIEGLTTYLSDHLYKADKGEDRDYRKNRILRYHAYVPKNNDLSLADFRNIGHSEINSETIRSVGYDKGAMFFHMLKNEVGDKIFFQALREFNEEKSHSEASWQDLKEIFSRVAKHDLTIFFNQWLKRSDIPEFAITNLAVNQLGGQSHISFRLTQKSKEKYDQLTIPITVETITGPVHTSIKLEAENELHEIIVDTIPIKIVFDPDYDLIRRLDPLELTPTWSRFAGSSNKKAILADESLRNRYQPLINYLASIDCPTLLAGEIKNSDLAKASYLFIGPSSHSRALLAGPPTNNDGFILDIHNNPFDPSKVLVLASGENFNEVKAATPKIRHYGSYGYLHFKNGRNIAKRTLPSQNGIEHELMELPIAMPASQVTDFKTVIEGIEKSRVIYLGENHTDYGYHIMQLQVIQALHAKGVNLAVGMEMFPHSSQQALDDYINGNINDENEFIKRSRYFSVWGFDYRLYRDIINFAGKYNLPIIGLNLDKQIVSQAFRNGNLDGLSEEQLHSLPAERDLTLPGYQQRLKAIHDIHDTSAKSPDSFNGFLQAQALWDETMAQTIADYLAAHPDKVMVVLVGGGHVYKANAIPPRVARRINVPQSVLVGIDSLEPGHNSKNFADYMLRIPYAELEASPKIGVSLIEEKNDDKKSAKIKVVGISPHGKAGEAGIKEGDYILSVDGAAVTTIGELKASLFDKKVGDFVVVGIEREGREHLKVELSSLEGSGKMPPSHPPIKK